MSGWDHPAFATREEFAERVGDVLAAESERETEERWWYISFADETFLGGVIVKAAGMLHAVRAAHLLGINPGGEAQGIPVPPGHLPPANMRNRLLTRREVEEEL